MQNFIANYFFENKNCFLPGVGLLSLKSKTANFHFGDKEMEAPKPTINFERSTEADNAFVNYVALQSNCSTEQAKEKVENFANEIINLQANEEVEIDFIGKFSKDLDNEIVFEQALYPEPFLPNVAAERVVHKNEAHNMVVGDTETNTTVMSDYLEAKPKSKVYKWWLSAIIITALSLLVLSIYFLGNFKVGIFNNVNSINAATADSTYSIKK